jgi:hypothetical protein
MNRGETMHGKVTVWYMTEEERQEYIKKHPIVPTKRERIISFSEIPKDKYKKHQENSMKSKKGDK